MSNFQPYFEFCACSTSLSFAKSVDSFWERTNAPERWPEVTRRVGELAYFRFVLFATPSGTSCILTLIYILGCTLIFGAAGLRFAYWTPRSCHFILRRDRSGTSRGRSWEKSRAQNTPHGSPPKSSYVPMNLRRKRIQHPRSQES